jgi:triosephosphate isomerase
MKLIIANWKSHKNQTEVSEWMNEFGQQSKLISQSEVVIAPPFPFVFQVGQMIKLWKRSYITLGVQDISPYPAGSYTGAVTVRNLAGSQVKYAIVGHSERRRYFHETHAEVGQKVDQLLAEGITPVVCIDDEYLLAQANAITADQLAQCVVAYEPLEAIGSGENQPVAEVEPIVARIKQTFGQVPVLYGGSVDATNVDEYLQITDGVLVGGASLKVSDFLALCR